MDAWELLADEENNILWIFLLLYLLVINNFVSDLQMMKQMGRAAVWAALLPFFCQVAKLAAPSSLVGAARFT